MSEKREKVLAIRNLERFQHYKDRNPVWVKLYVKTLDDEQLNEMPTATRLLAILLLLVAARRNNRIPNDAAWIAAECSVSLRESKVALADLLAVAFLVPASQLASQNASDPASNGASGPASETATSRSRALAERTETEKEQQPPQPPHDAPWLVDEAADEKFSEEQERLRALMPNLKEL